MGDLQSIFEIGPMVWRAFGRVDLSGPFDEADPDMLEPWLVERMTPQKVFIVSLLDPENPPHKVFVLSRSMLQRHGWAVSSQISNGAGATKGGRFLARRPETYRRKTIGYALRSEACAVFGLEPGASETDVRQAYVKLLMAHHPDHGGDQATFMRIQEAFESLSKPLGLDTILDFVRRESVNQTSDANR